MGSAGGVVWHTVCAGRGTVVRGDEPRAYHRAQENHHAPPLPRATLPKGASSHGTPEHQNEHLPLSTLGLQATDITVAQTKPHPSPSEGATTNRALRRGRRWAVLR